MLNLTTNCIEIIVIDNASTDKTSDFLQSLSHQIKILYNKINMGCAFAWNQGIKSCSGEWSIILNNDTRIPEFSFPKLIEFAEKNRVSVVSPGMREGPLNYDFNSYSIEYVDLMRTSIRPGIANGACFAVHSSVFEKLGLFDESFRVGQYEDADFFRRCIYDKINLATTGTSFIHHFGSSTQNLVSKKINFEYGKINQAYYRQKWNIGFLRRHFERYNMQAKLKYWSTLEYYKYNHSLIEKFNDGKIFYY